MSKRDILPHFMRVDRLVREINQFVPNSLVRGVEFRSDLAGLLVVSMAASYEACVKETLVNYASSHNEAFGTFAANNYSKINSKVNIGDLYKYTELFGDGLNEKFKNNLKLRKERINRKIGKNIEERYRQILSWRHIYAHTGVNNTSVEEAVIAFNVSKRVIYCFNEAFD